jgi:preprotein translocase subunit SecF
MRWFKDANYDFMTKRRLVMLISIVPIIIGLISIAVKGGLETSIDFAGGMLVEVGFGNPVTVQEVRAVLERAGFAGAEVTNFGNSQDVLIQIKHIGQPAETAARLEAALKEQLKGQAVDIRRVETVGPKVGSELKSAAFWAVIWSCLGIIAYVTWRFQFRMAVAAIVALIHDVFFTLGFFSITNKEISIAVIAAILTIIGYSLNDTIVVFDRVRENLQARRGREGFMSLVNVSVNQTLSRTIITGLTTILSLVVLILVAGPVIRDFSVALLIGMVVGTYSSVYIASALLIEWDLWRSKHRKIA